MQAKDKYLRVARAKPGLVNLFEDFSAPPAKEIKRARLLRKFSMSHVERYQGLTNPVTHVETFEDLILV